MEPKDRGRVGAAAFGGIDGASLFRSLAENSDWCVFVVDEIGRCRAVNEACCRWLKREEKEIVGRLVADFWPFAGEREAAEDAQVRCGERIDKEEEGMRDGRLYRLLIRKVPVRDTVGGVCAVLCLFREIGVEIVHEAAQRPDAVVFAPPSLANAKTILVVDPDVEVILAVTRVLSIHGYYVRAVREGRQALNFYREHPEEIHLVVLDQNLPGKSGMETTEDLRSLNPRLPVILMSGDGRPEALEEPDTLRFRFVNKPLNPEQLVSWIGEMVAAARRPNEEESR